MKLQDKEDQILFEIKQLEKELEKQKESFLKDVIHQAPWYMEAIYKNEFELKFWKNLIEESEIEKVGFEKAYEHNKKLLLRECLKSYFFEESTGAMHRLCSLWRHQSKLKMLERVFEVTEKNLIP